MSTIAAPSMTPVTPPMATVRPLYFVMAAAGLVVMVVAILGPSDWFLNWVHVMSGTLWTGIDLFMGFVIGPILRAVSFETRRAIVTALIPRTLVLMPTLSIITGTAGWFLAVRMGFLEVDYPEFYWVVAALVIIAILTVQGLGFLLPTNLRVYRELRKPQPDAAKIARLMKWYIYVVAMQGVMQVAIIVVMARFATGL
ncbi:MAG TPA: hypothetical protein VNQ56_12590 [Pseudolabrys sp.]|nr:hypothetical protein [Pseudolabrys sp.]